MTTRKRKLKLVSVPYRGATFLNLLQAFLDRIYEAGVSVPYRGATFLNKGLIWVKQIRTQFPSPIGELHFSIGDYMNLKGFDVPFPSPIGELHFSIVERW